MTMSEHRIQLSPGGRTFSVAPGETVLDAAMRQGVHLPYSCRDGQCGTCRARVLSGAVHYPGDAPGALSETQGADGAALLCRAVPDSDLCIEADALDAAPEIPPRRLPGRVARVERLAHDVVRMFLKLPSNQRLVFRAGQHLDFLLQDGRRRSFSMANGPEDNELLELHIRHVPEGAFTTHLFDQPQDRALYRIEAPLGTFFLRSGSQRPIIFLAGGTGFAPIKSMLEHAFARGDERPIHLYWGARERRDLYLDELPRRWAAERTRLRYTPVLSEARHEDRWPGRTGLVHTAVLEDYPDLSGYDVYASGPPEMVRAAQSSFRDRGLPMDRYFADPFEYAGDSRRETG